MLKEPYSLLSKTRYSSNRLRLEERKCIRDRAEQVFRLRIGLLPDAKVSTQSATILTLLYKSQPGGRGIISVYLGRDFIPLTMLRPSESPS